MSSKMVTRNKLNRIEKHSSLAKRGIMRTFYASLDNIPDHIIVECPARIIGELVDIMRKVYDKGHTQGYRDGVPDEV